MVRDSVVKKVLVEDTGAPHQGADARLGAPALVESRYAARQALSDDS
jgi:hypothetical protein